ncbi:MAG: transposase [Oligoflexia bacterium]|nr:transposase [Oligoflexia bacterium]
MRQQILHVIDVFINELFKSETTTNTTYAYKRFTREMIAGIVGAGSVLVSNIARFLDESTHIGNTEKRLCSMLDNERFPRDGIQEQAIEIGTRFVDQQDVIAFDIGDITKKYAKKMDHLYLVHDGSTGKNRLGWELFGIEAIHWKNSEKFHTPLYSKFINADCKDYISQNYQIIKAVKSVQKFLGPYRGIWTFDRLHDRNILFKELLKMPMWWIVRMKFNRILHVDGNVKIKIEELIEIMSLSKAAWRFLFPKISGELHVSWRKVRLPSNKNEITLIIIRDYRNERPIIFLTNIPVKDDLSAVTAFGYYLERWGIEEGCRFLKEIFDLENLRTREWKSIQNLVFMSHLSYLFISCFYRHYNKELNLLSEKLNKNFYSIDTIHYRYYRIAKLLQSLLQKEHLDYKAMLPATSSLLSPMPPLPLPLSANTTTLPAELALIA